ncbi:TPA: hypothetical protein DDZ86_03475 [Candidatus Dependentiae bacterium]|nr:MAG: hypothetical protein UW09_C0003G0048 [candidate division TM6 bacterium GW2011_GWF2_43_87]HBL98676.1 hypothetical protein [Candidatus Dependentiae bacterium]
MKNHLIIIYSCALAWLLPMASALCAEECCTSSEVSGSACTQKTLWFPRSAGDNLVLDQHRFGYRYNEECRNYGGLNISYRYQRNFHASRIAESLFGSCGLNFAGSQATSRSANTAPQNALLADYFGLSHKQDNLAIVFKPLVQNHCIDFKLYVGLDEVFDGLYMQLNFPVVHTNWNLSGGKSCCTSACNDCCNLCCGGSCTPAPTPTCGVTACQLGLLNTTPFPAGYMSNMTTVVSPLSTLIDALNGKPFGDFQGRTYGGFSGDCRSTKLAGVYVDLGYNFFECPDYHLGAYIKVVAPTGTNMNCDGHVKNIFHPIVGDYHWQLGAGISGAAELYNCEDDHTITAYLQGYVTHLFEREQVRTFDLKNSDSTPSPMSRYMLMKEFKSSTNLAYNDKLWSVIDWSTRKAKIKVDAKGEGLIEIEYKNSCGLSLGVGYEIYGRSKEKICKTCMPCYNTMIGKTLGLKGTAPVYAQAYLATPLNVPVWALIPGTGNPAYPYNVSATQSNATAYKEGTVDSAVAISVPNPVTGTLLNEAAYVTPLTFPGLTGITATDTANINLSQLQESSSTPVTAITPVTGAITGITRNPTLLTDDKLDISSAALNSYTTNKVFGYVDYAWDDCCDWKPAVYGGIEAEFAKKSDKHAMNAWAIWFGMGLGF